MAERAPHAGRILTIFVVGAIGSGVVGGLGLKEFVTEGVPDLVTRDDPSAFAPRLDMQTDRVMHGGNFDPSGLRIERLHNPSPKTAAHIRELVNGAVGPYPTSSARWEAIKACDIVVATPEAQEGGEWKDAQKAWKDGRYPDVAAHCGAVINELLESGRLAVWRAAIPHNGPQ